MKFAIRYSVICTLAAGGIFISLLGCGQSSDVPPLGTVHGTVSLDSKPVPNATVIFTPVAGGRGSSGKTDESGAYQLEYVLGTPGALIGEHSVIINSENYSGEGAKDALLPAPYNLNTQLKATVNTGSNKLDFPLTTAGTVPQ